MATIPKDRIYAVAKFHEGSPASLHVPEAANQTYVVGEIGYFDTAGQFAELAGDTPAEIYGVSEHDASGVQATMGSVWLANPDTLFEANMLEGSAADHVLVAADLGTVMGIQRVTADSKVYLNSAVKDGASARVFVHGLARGSVLGDTNARVLFTFLPKFVQHLATS